MNYRRDAEAAAGVVARIESAGGSARSVAADVCDPAQVRDLVAELPRIDALVCNANIVPPFGSFAELSWSDFSAKVLTELAAVYHVSQRVLEVMRAQRGGRIVYVSSLSADLLRPGTIAHATAKAALNTFAQHVAAEAGRYGVTVNTVAPGAVRTKGTAAMRTPEMEATYGRRSTLGRMLDPADVAAVVGTVLDPGFAAVAATYLPIDAGYRALAD